MSNSILKVHQICYAIPYGSTIFEDVSFEIEAGEFVGILGKNGAGKTTLVDLIMGIRSPVSGELTVFGEGPNSYNRKQPSAISYLSHNIVLKTNITISQFFDFHGSFYENYSKEVEEKVSQMLGLDVHNKIGSLSTGQQKKVQIAAALATKPQLLVVDEITAVLDPESRSLFYKIILEQMKENNMAILLATNLAEDLIGKASRIIFLDNKTSKEYDSGSIQKIFKIDVAS